MRTVQIKEDTKGKVLTSGGVKLTCPYVLRQCRPNCAFYGIDPDTGRNGSVKCGVNDKLIGELE